MAALPDLTPGGVERRLWFVVRGAQLVVAEAGAAVALPTDEQARALGAWERAHYLGPLGPGHAFALAAEAEPEPPLAARGLRGLFGALDERLFGAAGRALQVVEWALTSRFCGQCGRPTAAVPGERATRCSGCERVYYPRIAPAIIVLVRRGEEALLARNVKMPSGFYSTLAGFSEIGETLEETLVREVREEVGVEVANPRYFGSQPWPFPHSLMIGFFADWVGGEIRVDPSEIADARWFRADALPAVPPPVTIARRLIDAWVSEVK